MDRDSIAHEADILSLGLFLQPKRQPKSRRGPRLRSATRLQWTSQLWPHSIAETLDVRVSTCVGTQRTSTWIDSQSGIGGGRAFSGRPAYRCTPLQTCCLRRACASQGRWAKHAVEIQNLRMEAKNLIISSETLTLIEALEFVTGDLQARVEIHSICAGW